MELKDLVGRHYLSGVEFGKIESGGYEDAEIIDFILDGEIISAVEDPDDGYRSSLSELIVNRKGTDIKNQFQPVEVLCVVNEGKYGEDDLIDFVDMVTVKIVLTIGTRDFDDYYPCFVANWVPENLCLNQVKK